MSLERRVKGIVLLLGVTLLLVPSINGDLFVQAQHSSTLFAGERFDEELTIVTLPDGKDVAYNFRFEITTPFVNR